MDTLLDQVYVRTMKSRIRLLLDATDGFSNKLSTFSTRFISEHQLPCMPEQYGTHVILSAKKIQKDFFVVSGDSEIQVSKLVMPLSMLFAQRPSLIIAAFSPNGFGTMMYLNASDVHLSLDTFLTSCSPGLRKIVWLLGAIVSHAIRDSGVSHRTSRADTLRLVMHWIERYVRGWSTTIPSLLLIDEIACVCRRVIEYRCITKALMAGMK